MKLITSIHKLSLDKFIDAFCDEDYSGIIIEGKPTEKEIAAAWSDIIEQYTDAMNDDGQKKYISIYKEYQQAKIRHDLVITYIEMLNNYFIPKWAKELNQLVGSSFDFKTALDKSIDEYKKLLLRCYNRNKGNLIRYQLAQSKLEEIAKVQAEKGGSRPDRAYFTKVMVNLKKMESREIPSSISTYEFCILVNNYKDYINHFENQKAKRGRH